MKKHSMHMHKHTLWATAFMAWALGTASLGSVQARTFANDDDDKTASAVPDNIKDLSGKQIDYSNYKNFVTTGRPYGDQKKMFLLYNVGTGKFLNIGGYWGTQGTLSDVPRPFWLQRRNEDKVQNLWAYKRYPEVNADKGKFVYEFFNLPTMQIGNTEGKTHGGVTYDYVRVMNTDGTVKQTILENGKPDGGTFKQTLDGFSFDNSYIDAVIDMSGCLGKRIYKSDGTADYNPIETLLSLGENVDHWTAGSNGTDGYVDLHIYGYQFTTDDDIAQYGQYGVKVQCLDRYSRTNDNQSGTPSQRFIKIGSDNKLHVVVKRGSIMVNGVNCMPGASTYDSPIKPFLAQTKLSLGQTQGKKQSRAIYNYVRVHTAQAQTPCDTCLVVNGLYDAQDGVQFSQALPKKGNLNNYTVRAEVDLGTIPADKDADENILSVGTNVATWNGGHNIHLYYNANSKTLKCNAANSAKPGGVKEEISNVTGNVKIELSKDGLTVNGAQVFGTDNAIVKALLADDVTALEVGNTQGNKSHAAYHYVNYSYKENKHTFPESGDVWDGTAFSKKIAEGNLDRFELYATLDLSTCTLGTSDGKNAENILSIGTDINNWYTKDNASSQNLHIYYNAATKKIEFDAVNNEYTGGAKKFRYTTSALTDAQLKSVELKLTRSGLFMNGELVSDGGSNVFTPEACPVIKYLLEKSDDIYVGSTQGDCRATYTLFDIVPVNTNTQNVVRPGYVSQGTKWGGSYSGTLTNKVIEAEIDLSTTGKGGNENVLSIGNNIAIWGSTNANSCNLHFYFNGSALTMQAVTQTYNNGTKTTFKEVSKASTVKVKLSKDGLFVNGEQVKTTTDLNTNKDVDMSALIEMLTDPEVTTSIQVGSREGEKTLPQGRSYATYNTLAVTISGDDSVIEEGTPNEGKSFSNDYEGNLGTKTVTAKINTSTCKDSANENIFSVGTYISDWGTTEATPATAYNLHFYYKKSTNELKMDIVKRDGKKYTSVTCKPSKRILNIVVSKDGVTVNGEQLTTSTEPFADVMTYLTRTTQTFQVGSCEGKTRSYASYISIDVTDNAATAAAKAKAAAKADATATEVVYQPVSNQQGDGKAKYMTDAYTLDFAAGDYVEADIDLSTCKEQYENVFSIGTDITVWGQSEKAHNIHIYYTGTDADGTVNAYVVYVNKDHSDDYKRMFSVTPAADGSAHMKLKFSADGLFINDADMYPATDPMPTIVYNDKLAGEMVRFKYTDDMIPVLDEHGKYIPLQPGDEGYDKAHGIMVKQDNYIYTSESRTDQTMAFFLSSRFTQETVASQNEGVFLSWAPRLTNNDKWGTIGLFADRNLPQKEVGADASTNYSQWFFEPVSVTGNDHVYRLYLKMNNVEVPKREGKTATYTKQSGKFYLQASDIEIYGNQLENYGGGYDDKTEMNYEEVEVLNSTPAKPEYAYWKLFDVEEYHRLFGSQASEMTSMLDLSFQLRDPDFLRESNELSQWTMDSNLQSAADNLKVRIGYDNYSKKQLTDKNYTDNEGKKTTTKTVDGKVVVTEQASAAYDVVKNRTGNHGRYMGVDVRKGGYGKMYQDTKLYYAGWYTVSVQGLSTVGAKLFIQLVTDTLTGSVAEAVTQPLYKPTQAELDELNNTTNVTWPHDYIDATHPMPLYNALVDMNDDNLDPNYVDHYKSQVSFYVDPDVLAKNKTLTLRFGVDIPQSSQAGGTSAQADDDTATTTEDAGWTNDGSDWTVFDHFRLMFGGKATEPNIILDEDSTNLDYIEKTLHVFDSRPMRLHRTFKGGQWNTLILPVNLTYSGFSHLFGDNAKLATLDHLTETTIEFATLSRPSDDATLFLKAFQPYIIWVDADHEQGTESAYTAQLYNKADGGKTYDEVTIGDNHFYAEAVNLEGLHKDDQTQQYYYSFKDDTSTGQTINFASGATAYTTGKLYTYKDSHVATGNSQTNLRAYGTLCKNFGISKATGKNDIIDGHDNLADAYVQATGGMRHIAAGSKYGTKGFRCWFMPESLTSSDDIPASFKVAIDGVEDSATSIDDINDADGVLIGGRYANGIYNLGGQKVRDGRSTDGLPAGIYIVNGMKVAVK